MTLDLFGTLIRSNPLKANMLKLLISAAPLASGRAKLFS